MDNCWNCFRRGKGKDAPNNQKDKDVEMRPVEDNPSGNSKMTTKDETTKSSDCSICDNGSLIFTSTLLLGTGNLL